MARRSVARSSQVPFLHEKQIEREADALLGEYGERFETIIEPPVPIDEIIEIHLQLTFDVADLQQVFDAGDVHGAIWINEGRIAVDKSLDPTANPRKLGRYRFTLAHETGHWRLHRGHYLKNTQQQSLFEYEGKPSFICRSNDSQPVEWQANAFAAYLLMPRKMVHAAWEAWRGDLDSVVIDDLRSQKQQIRPKDVDRLNEMTLGDDATDNILFETFCRPIANRFEVSAQAMRIRLEQLGMLLRKKENLLF